MEIREEIRLKAKRALSKSAEYGADIDISKYMEEPEKPSINLGDRMLREKLKSIGVNVSAKSIAGSYLQLDKYIIDIYSKHKGIEILSLEEALDKHKDWIMDYYWKAVPVDKDKYTALAELYGEGGYVIIVKDGIRVQYPIQTCMILKSKGIIQAPHNIIITGKNCEINVITGCGVIKETANIHAGISEFYVGERSRINFIMIHGWSKYQHVRPRSGAIVSDDGVYVSYYITFSPSKTLQLYPAVFLRGDRSKTYLTNVLIGSRGENIDVGSAIYMYGQNTAGGIISRIIAKGRSKIVSRARIYGYGKDSKGHIECTGLLLSDMAEIETIPELKAFIDRVSLTHEASIGRLAEDEIIYLMSKGFGKNEAEAILIRGFMRVDLQGIPRPLKRAIEQAVAIASTGL